MVEVESTEAKSKIICTDHSGGMEITFTVADVKPQVKDAVFTEIDLFVQKLRAIFEDAERKGGRKDRGYR